MLLRANFNKNAFTLAELLIAIAIIGILFAAALPAMTNLMGRTKLDAAADAVHAAAKRARQHAVAHKQPTYLVFHTARTDSTLAHRAYALFTIDLHAPPVRATDGHFIGNWETLPDGVVFDPNVNLDENVFDAAGGPWQGALTRNNELLIEGATYVTIGFKPNGQIASATRHIHLTEGVVVDGNAIAFPTAPGKQIHFTTFGKSVILDYLTDADGAFNALGENR